MQHAAAMLYCPNPTCQASNLEEHKFCHKCRTPLVRQYLWSIGNVAAYEAGDLLGDRYLYKGSGIFLDTQPALPSNNVSELPARFLPYLRLAPLRLHISQVYEWLPAAPPDEVLLLLDYAPLSSLVNATSSAESPVSVVQVLPKLIEAWQEANPVRQLNWLWQMANLWQPLSSEQVASSLLDAEMLRVEGGIVRLLELRPDADAISLAALGEMWLRWSATARPEIALRMQQISQELIDGRIYNAEVLVERLDEAIAQISPAQSRQMQIATLSDQGPTRQRNEDACYPKSGTAQILNASALVIVCDGIGGHQGGDVASHLAIEAVKQRVSNFPELLDPVTLTVELEKTVCAANDQISQRNDSEQRQDRQRMGTTLVMGLVHHHELYVTHVGDSRAYWITRWGCHQITLDDDVASREVRLGYSAYRQALQQPSAGSLVQALGMGASNLLYPTVQRFILDEDSVFLFCSDGLSDNDRVESCWDTEILPILEGKADLPTVAQRLVEIANTLNGYDNATVGLLHCQVTAPEAMPTLSDRSPAEVPTRPPSPAATIAVSPGLKPAVAEAKAPQKPNPVPLLIGIVLLASLGGVLWAALGSHQAPPIQPAASPSTPPSSPPPTAALPSLSLTVGSQLRLQTSPAGTPSSAALPVLLSSPSQALPASPDAAGTNLPDAFQPGNSRTVSQPLGMIPGGSVLEVVELGEASRPNWVRLRICSTPEAPLEPAVSAIEAVPSPEDAVVTPLTELEDKPVLSRGQEGWILQAEISSPPFELVQTSTVNQNCPSR